MASHGPWQFRFRGPGDYSGQGVAGSAITNRHWLAGFIAPDLEGQIITYIWLVVWNMFYFSIYW